MKKKKAGQGLDKEELAKNLVKVLNVGKNANKDSDPDQMIKQTAKLLADAIDEYVRSGKIVVDVSANLIASSANVTVPPTGIIPVVGGVCKEKILTKLE